MSNRTPSRANLHLRGPLNAARSYDAHAPGRTHPDEQGEHNEQRKQLLCDAWAHSINQDQSEALASRKSPSTLDQSNDHRYNRQKQKDVNEPSHGVGTGQSKSPENQ